MAQAYKNRVQDLSEDMLEYMHSVCGSGIPPEDVLTYFRKKYPEAPPITSKDLTNLKTPIGGESQDASLLLQRLLGLHVLRGCACTSFLLCTSKQLESHRPLC